MSEEILPRNRHGVRFPKGGTASKKSQDSNERDKGMFDREEGGGAENDGKGATKSRNPLAPTPKTVL